MSMKPKIIRLIPRDRRAALDEQLRDERLSYTDLARELNAQGWDVSREHVRNYALHMGLRTQRPNPVTKIEALLTPEHRTEYEALIADPRTTLDAATEWLRGRGYPVGRKSTGTHRSRFLVTLKRVRDSARLAGEMIRLGHGNAGTTAMSGGMLVRCEQVLMEQLVRLREQDAIDTKQLAELCKMVNGAVVARETLEATERENERAKRRAVEEGERLSKAGASGKDVVERMKAILGV